MKFINISMVKPLAIVVFLCLFFNNYCYGGIDIVSTQNPTNADICDGEIKIEASGEAGPFKVKITNDQGFEENFQNINGTIIVDGLCAGNYNVRVESAQGCGFDFTVEICTIDFDYNIVYPGNPNPYGSITINATSGSSPYFYNWTYPNGSSVTMTTNVINNLDQSGIYKLEITDASGCTAKKEFTFANGNTLPNFSNKNAMDA